MKTFRLRTVLFLVLSIGPLRDVRAEKAPDIRGFQRSTFDAAFSRADREVDAEKWMEEARRGASSALAAWERSAVSLYDDPALRAEIASEASSWTEAELEERFAAWLDDRFFGMEAARLEAVLAQAAEAAHQRYLYLTDAEGNIRYDAATGDPLVVRPGEGNDTTEADRISWQAMTTDVRDRLLGAEAARMEALRPELLAYVASERRESFSSLFAEAASSALGRTARELDALLAQEERLFVARRTGDVWSLRNKSEGEAASAIAAELAAETAASCEVDLNALEARIEAACGGTGELALAGSAWLDQYREQFSRGLSAWEEAEERFMVRRLEWERDATLNFVEGDEAWETAFGKLEEERKVWEVKARRLFEAGEEAFARSSEILERAIAEAKAEFERDADLRSQASADSARAWVDSYLVCGSVVAGARESLEFWIPRVACSSIQAGGLPADLGDPALGAWIDAQVGGIWASIRDTYAASEEYEEDLRYIENLREEVRVEWTADFASALGRVAGARASIRTLEREAAAHNRTPDPVLIESLTAEIAEALTEAEDYRQRAQEIQPSGGPESDVGLWEVMEAEEEFVLEHELWYELDAMSRRPPSDPTYFRSREGDPAPILETVWESFTAVTEIRKWITLYREYSSRAIVARDALTEEFDLTIGSGGLVDVLDPAASSEDFYLDEYQVELIRARAVAGYWAKRVGIAEAVTEYATALGAGRATDAESVEGLRNAKTAYDAATEAYALAQAALTAAGGGVEAARAAVERAAAELAAADTALEELNAEYALKLSVIAVGNADFLAEDLTERYEELVAESGLLARGDAASLRGRYLERARSLGHAEDLETAAKALSEYVRGAENEDSIAELDAAYRAIIVPTDAESAASAVETFGLAEDDPAFAAAASFIEQRASAVETAAAEDKEAVAATWGELIRLTVTDAAQRAFSALAARLDAIAALGADDAASWYLDRSGSPLGGDALEPRLRADLETARNSLLRSRAELELEAIRFILHGDVAGAAAKTLASLAPLAMEAAEAAATDLEALIATLDDVAGASDAVYDAALAALAAENRRAADFVNGEGFFVLSTGENIAPFFLSDSSAAVDRAQGRLAAYLRAGSSSPAFDADRRTACWMGIRAALSGAGIALPGQGLPTTSAIGEALAGASGLASSRAADLLVAIDAAAAGAPSWVAREIASWRSAIVDYAAARAYRNTGARPDTTVPQAAAGASAARSAAVSAVMTSFSTSDPESARSLCAVYALNLGDLGGIEARELADEAAGRIARSLLSTVDTAIGEDELEDALRSAADTDHAYAAAAIRDKAISLAAEAAGNGETAEAFTPDAALDEAVAFALSDTSAAAEREAARAAANLECAAAWAAVADAASHDAAFGRGQWRTYLGGIKIEKERYAASWAEGRLADSYETADRANGAVQAAFASWDTMAGERTGGGEAAFNFTAFREEARGFLIDPSRDADAIAGRRVSAAVRDAAESAYGKLLAGAAKIAALGVEIARLGKITAESSTDEALRAAIDDLSSRIYDQRIAYTEAVNAYGRSAAALSSAGAAYDSAYAGTKISYGAYETARHEYEKWEAIRRWAATSYLGADETAAAYRSPAAELAYARDRQGRADVALVALRDLYREDTTMRPYEDPAYAALYETYRGSFSLMMLAVKARDALDMALRVERDRNENLYANYIETLLGGSSAIAHPISYPEGPVPAADSVQWVNVLRVEGGGLRIAYDANYTLTVADSAMAESLRSYFNVGTNYGNETQKSTAFERELRGLCSRLASYGLSGRLATWSLARDHLVGKLVAANDGYAALAAGLRRADALYADLGEENVYRMNIGEVLDGYRTEEGYTVGYDRQHIVDSHGDYWVTLPLNMWSGRTFRLQDEWEEAWNTLGRQEQEDLELLTALSLAGCINSASFLNAFASMSEVKEYELIDTFIDRKIRNSDFPWKGRTYWRYRGMQKSYERLVPALIADIPVQGAAFGDAVAAVEGRWAAYAESSARLAALEGAAANGAAVTWAAVENSLRTVGGLTDSELARLAAAFAQYTADAAAIGSSCSSASAALADCAIWARQKRTDLRDALDAAWAEDEESRAEAQNAYRATFDRYVAGTASAAELAFAARPAYGNAAPSRRTYLMRLEAAIADAAFASLGTEGGFSSEHTRVVQEYATLASTAMRSRIEAELAARQVEWDALRLDLTEKRAAWRDAAGLILERGRADWTTGAESMREARLTWNLEYADRYERTNAAWNCAWLESMQEKQGWADRATEAASSASYGAILALIGSDAEAAGRRMDGRGCWSLPASGADAAEAAASDVLSRSGIVKLSEAFTASSRSIATVATAVRRGLGG